MLHHSRLVAAIIFRIAALTKPAARAATTNAPALYGAAQDSLFRERERVTAHGVEHFQ
jgi:hypothetical protein